MELHDILPPIATAAVVASSANHRWTSRRDQDHDPSRGVDATCVEPDAIEGAWLSFVRQSAGSRPRVSRNSQHAETGDVYTDGATLQVNEGASALLRKQRRVVLNH